MHWPSAGRPLRVEESQKLIETDDQELKQKFKQVMRETSVTRRAEAGGKAMTDKQRFNQIMKSYTMLGTTADLHTRSTRRTKQKA